MCKPWFVLSWSETSSYINTTVIFPWSHNIAICTGYKVTFGLVLYTQSTISLPSLPPPSLHTDTHLPFFPPNSPTTCFIPPPFYLLLQEARFISHTGTYEFCFYLISEHDILPAVINAKTLSVNRLSQRHVTFKGQRMKKKNAGLWLDAHSIDSCLLTLKTTTTTKHNTCRHKLANEKML